MTELDSMLAALTARQQRLQAAHHRRMKLNPDRTGAKSKVLEDNLATA
jgi:hypothetical protein